MSNGPVKNCALGICCPPPAQVGALAQIIDEVVGEDLRQMPQEFAERLCHKVAKGLIDRGLIGLPIGAVFGEWVRMAMGPSVAPKEL